MENIELAKQPKSISFHCGDEIVAEFSGGKFKYKGKEIDDIHDVYSALNEWVTKVNKS